MCGIAGLTFEGNTQNEESRVEAMTRSMSHRGPDAQGIWSGTSICLGHRRLAILDLSDAAAQPMLDSTGRYAMVFNGEIYNYQEIKEELQEYTFNSSGDTEMLLAAFHKWGNACFERFNGMFAVAIWDKQEEKLTLARDRMGIKPLYYHYSNRQLSFASEIRALLASERVPRKLNHQALGEYLQYYSVNSPHTLVADVYMLKAGHIATWTKDHFSTEQYWSLADQADSRNITSEEQLKKENLDLLTASVERRMISDVPLGAFLSGGIDSSAIVALMATISEQPIHTFSVVFDEKEFDESPYSSLIAQKYHTQHHPIRLSPSDFLTELPNALEAMDHPSGDGINSYVVSKATREQGFTVALSGLGGDELYAGYPVFKQYQKLQSMGPLYAIPAPLRKMGAGVVGAVSRGAKVARFQQMLATPNRNFESVYPIFRQIFSEKEINQLLASNASLFSFEGIFSEQDLRKINQLPVFSQVSVGEMATYTQNVLLRDTDVHSMAHSLEVRVPFFDHTLVEFALRIPDQLKEPEGYKKFLVESLGSLLPEEVVFRKKMGFMFPWRDWLKGPLKPLVDEKMERLAQRGLFDGGELKMYWERFWGR